MALAKPREQLKCKAIKSLNSARGTAPTLAFVARDQFVGRGNCRVLCRALLPQLNPPPKEIRKILLRKTLVVGYSWRSTDIQERAIPDQQSFAQKWAKEHGYKIIRLFIDDAFSGTSVKERSAFEQLAAITSR